MEASTGSTHAYRWIPLGIDQLYHGGEAQAVSQDGSVIGGFEFSGGSGSTIRRATRWSTEHSGAQLIDDPNTSTSSQTMGVSADGNTLVGFAQFTGVGMRAFSWTAAGGMVNIGSTSATGPASQALSVSRDGSVIVGYTTSSTGVQRAIAWTTSGTIDLGALTGAPFSVAYAVSADGSTIVGTSGPNSVSGHRAFIWTAQSGVRDLNTVLSGVLPAGWTILEAHAVSADGRFVAGSAGGGAIAKEAFLANVSTPTCYANCDRSTDAPALNVNDFICFQAAFAAGDSYANCDQSSTPPVLNVNDFICFQAAFAAGCP
jgi:probable HAF family extracellular repeat protein